MNELGFDSVASILDVNADSGLFSPPSVLDSGRSLLGGTELIGGYLETDSSGEINVEYLLDSGQFSEMRVGVFSLEGMDAYSSNWNAFKQEAARRIESDSVLGAEILNDNEDAAKFNSPVGWIRRYNTGEYQGKESFQVMPDAQYGIFILTRDSWSDVIANPSSTPWTRWLALELEGSPELFDSKQIADITGDGTLLGIEDIRLRWGGDRDYDDILFQITGANFVGHTGDELINPNAEWRHGELGQEIIDYALAQIGDEEPPVIQAALANDTGSSSSDGLTADVTIAGTVTDESAVASLRAGFGDAAVDPYTEIIDSVDSAGNFTLDKATLEAILGNGLTDGFYQLNLISTDSENNSSATTVSFRYDSTAPELNLLTPLVDGGHSSTARLIGSAADAEAIATGSYSLNGEENSALAISGDGWFDLGLGSETLSLGNYQLAVEISDAAGNQTSVTRNFAVTNDFATGATGSTGWGAANADTILLNSRDSLFSRAAVPVELGQSEGTRTLSFELETNSVGGVE